MEKYSVLMSVYIKEKPEFLKVSINSMVNQTIPPSQIVVIKDGKLTPELDEVLNDFQKNYPNLFDIVQLSRNVGLGNALNRGLEVCKYEMIARMDTDDISLLNRCQIQLEQFQNNPRLVICGTQINEFLEFPENIVSARTVPITKSEINKFSKRRSPFNHPTVMFKKTKILEFGGYRGYGRKEDLDLFLRIVFSGAECCNTEQVLLLYRTNKDNLKRRTTWENCSEYIKIMLGFYRKKNIGLIDVGYVIVGQILMFLLPKKIVSILNMRMLREKV